MLASWLALPLSFVLLWSILPPHQDRPLVTAFLLIFEVVIVAGLLWWSGVAMQIILIRRPVFLLLAIIGIAIFSVILFHGKLPPLSFFDEIWTTGTAWKQFNDLERFISISPDWNANTWFNFSGISPITGAYMKLFGVGILQARFFYFLLAWLALPFIYLISRKYNGRSAAFASVALGLFVPIHYNWARHDFWVPTATTIALYCYIFARSPATRTARIYSFFCGLFVASAVEGHVYGGAFALVFCALHFAQLVLSFHRQQEWRANNFWPFLAGCACFSVVWLGYHVVLSGLQFKDVIELIRDTYHWERHAVGVASQGGILSPRIWWKALQDYIFLQPFEVILLPIVFACALWRRRRGDLHIFGIWGSSLLLIGLLLAHITPIYYIFLFPLICVLFGSWLVDLFANSAKFENGSNVVFSFGAVYLLIAILCLYFFQNVVAANSGESIRQRNLLGRYAEIGRDINKLLPAEDIVVSGNNGYYLGMTHRLNYWSTFSFTWGLPEYWPLDPPQAIIVTLGLDEGYSGLADWLLQYDFQAVACYPIMSERILNEWATILYTLPELNSPVSAQNCSPEMLAWLDD